MNVIAEIAVEIRRQRERLLRPLEPRDGAATAWPEDGPRIEELAIGDEQPAALRARLEAAYAEYAPASPTESALVRQAVVAQIEIERLEKVRTAIQAAAIRVSGQKLEQKYEEEIHDYHRTSQSEPALALARLKRSAPGVRWLIAQWEELERRLNEDGTWYGSDRHLAVIFQGYSSSVDHLYFAEPAWRTWLDCFATYPNQKQAHIDMISDPRVVPQSVQDRDEAFWPPAPEASRARLRAIVDRELPPLRALAARLRVEQEAPERAAAREFELQKANALILPLLRTQQIHERSLAQAHRALAIRRRTNYRESSSGR